MYKRLLNEGRLTKVTNSNLEVTFLIGESEGSTLWKRNTVPNLRTLKTDGVRIFQGVNVMQVISLTSRIVMIVATEIKKRRKWDKDNLLHMQKYEVRYL